MQRLWFSLPSLSKISPAARPRLALTSSSPRQGKAPRPWAGGAEAQTPRAGSRRRAATGPRISVPTAAYGGRRRLPVGAGAAESPRPAQQGGVRVAITGGVRREEGKRGGGARPGRSQETGREAAGRWGGAGPSSGAGSPASGERQMQPGAAAPGPHVFRRSWWLGWGDGCHRAVGSAAFPTSGTTTQASCASDLPAVASAVHL